MSKVWRTDYQGTRLSNTTLSKVLSIDEFRGNAGGEKFQCIITNPEHKKVRIAEQQEFHATRRKYFKRSRKVLLKRPEKLTEEEFA